MPSYSNQGLHIAVRQLGPGSGEGQHTGTQAYRSPCVQERQQASNQTRRVRV
jgi:hypothetical protein